MAVIAYVASRSPEFPSLFPFSLAPATQAMAVTLVISGFTRERGGRVNSASHGSFRLLCMNFLTKEYLTANLPNCDSSYI